MATMLSMGILIEEAANCEGNVQTRSKLAFVDLGNMTSVSRAPCALNMKRLTTLEEIIKPKSGNVQVCKQP